MMNAKNQILAKNLLVAIEKIERRKKPQRIEMKTKNSRDVNPLSMVIPAITLAPSRPSGRDDFYVA